MRATATRVIACIAASVALAYATQARADDGRFFPDRPASAPLESATGVLTDFGIGNRSGTLTLKSPAGTKRTFYVSEHIMLDGKPIACDHPPSPGFHPSAVSCSFWPKNVVIGRTQVHVTFWTQTRPDTHEHVNVAARIESHLGL